MAILDSGERREFNTGAVRDITEGKGRCDLIPLDITSQVCDDFILHLINDYINNGYDEDIVRAIQIFSTEKYGSTYSALLELSKHFEDGAKKYGENNWQKGIPLHCYIDSGVRHYLKYMRGDTDEPHDRAFLWNMYCLLWTHHHKPEMIDLPFKKD